MFTCIDHVMFCVPDLEKGIAQYRKLGFDVKPGGDHPGKGTHNAIAFNDTDYLELLAVRDEAEYKAASSWGGGLPAFIAAGGGIRFVIIQSNDLAADVAAMKQRGVDVSDAIDGGRRTPGGQELKWKSAVLGPKNPLPLFFIEHLTPLAERKRITHHLSPITGDAKHPNGVYKLERSYIVVKDVNAEAALYAKVLGMPQPETHKGTVVMSDMAIFEIGPTGLGVVTPYAKGPASDYLERRGPGIFQALYRTKSMGAAAKWMQQQGMAPPARGTRSNGEQAMLVPPADTFGAYVGFVGPE